MSYPGNFLNMLFKMTEIKYQPNPVLERALDVLFILHADHEQNCSTHAMRGIRRSHVDPYSALAARLPRSTAAARRRERGESCACCRKSDRSRTSGLHQAVKGGEGRLMGFGHRVYKSYDPRAKIIKRSPISFSRSRERIRCSKSRLSSNGSRCRTTKLVSRRLYPNVDFYSGLIYQAMGFPVDMFPVLFAIPRTAGWIAQWEEMLLDPEQKIARRAIYGEWAQNLRPQRQAKVATQHSAISIQQ